MMRENESVEGKDKEFQFNRVWTTRDQNKTTREMQLSDRDNKTEIPLCQSRVELKIEVRERDR